jgi:hypothetical protein
VIALFNEATSNSYLYRVSYYQANKMDSVLASSDCEQSVPDESLVAITSLECLEEMVHDVLEVRDQLLA